MHGEQHHTDRPSYRGAAGTFVHQHRGVSKLAYDRTDFVRTAILGVAVAIVVWLLLQPIGLAWGRLLVFWRDALDLPAEVMMNHHVVPLLPDLYIPYYRLPAAIADRGFVLLVGQVTIGLLMVTFVLSRLQLALALFIRVVLVIHLTAVVYFLIAPASFPYTLEQYMSGMMTASLGVIAVTPILLGLTHFIFDFRIHQKLLLAAIVVGFLALFIPLKYVLQAWIMHHMSMLFMPVMYLICGIPLDVFLFIALYAWGMSWPTRQAPGGTTPIEWLDESNRPAER